MSQSHGSNSTHLCKHGKDDLLLFKPSIKMGKKGDLLNMVIGMGWSEYFRNSGSTGLFTLNHQPIQPLTEMVQKRSRIQ